jgi:pimeloyl-ACP methyl ester carboxylesterase
MRNEADLIIDKDTDARLPALYVHGLFMTGREGFALTRRLHREGIDCTRFGYSSRREAPDATATRLAMRLAANPMLNLVGHSLGGVISALAVARAPEWPKWHGRAVLIGPPLAGSDTARRAARLPGGRWLLGKGGRYLTDVLAPISGSPRVLVVAGVRNVGIGRLIGACAAPGDGQVRLVETRLSGSARRSVRRGHLALLFDRRVACIAAEFIHGDFRDG